MKIRTIITLPAILLAITLFLLFNISLEQAQTRQAIFEVSQIGYMEGVNDLISSPEYSDKELALLDIEGGYNKHLLKVAFNDERIGKRAEDHIVEIADLIRKLRQSVGVSDNESKNKIEQLLKEKTASFEAEGRKIIEANHNGKWIWIAPVFIRVD